MRVAKNSWQERGAAANRHKQQVLTFVCAKLFSGLASRPESARDALSQRIGAPWKFQGQGNSQLPCGIPPRYSLTIDAVRSLLLLRIQLASVQLAGPSHGRCRPGAQTGASHVEWRRTRQLNTGQLNSQ